MTNIGTVSTDPSEQGKKDLDPFHPSFRVKRIKHMKITDFQDDLFLDIFQCAKSGLITYKIEFDQKMMLDF
jgi:hypothetical protein